MLISNTVTSLVGAGLISLGIFFPTRRFVLLVFDFDIGHYAWSFFIIPGILLFIASFVFALRGGYMAWYRAGYPIERKEATAALPLDALCPDCGQPMETHADH